MLSSTTATSATVPTLNSSPANGPQPELKQAFQEFVAGTFYRQMLGAMRKTHGEAAYMHGGQAERVFQGQLDQQVAEDMARQNGAAFSGSLFETFQQQVTGRALKPTEKLPSPARLAAEGYAAFGS